MVDTGFIKGFCVSLLVVFSYKIYSDNCIKELEINNKLSNLEVRIENLEDFKFGLFQMYTGKKINREVSSSSDVSSSEEEEEETY